MADKVVFYQLTHKFVNHDQAVPEGPRQVIYYSLAIGHHVGVMDCLQSLMEVPLEGFRSWLACLPEGPARRKLEGVLKWGEIEINKDHARDLKEALTGCMAGMDAQQSGWSTTLVECLARMVQEPALYLMVRRFE